LALVHAGECRRSAIRLFERGTLDFRRKGALHLLGHPGNRLRTKLRTGPSSIPCASRSECGVGLLGGNELSHRADVAVGVAAHWTAADCAFWKFAENSSLVFRSSSRPRIALANLGKRNDPRAKVCITDTGHRGCLW